MKKGSLIVIIMESNFFMMILICFIQAHITFYIGQNKEECDEDNVKEMVVNTVVCANLLCV